MVQHLRMKEPREPGGSFIKIEGICCFQNVLFILFLFVELYIPTAPPFHVILTMLRFTTRALVLLFTAIHLCTALPQNEAPVPLERRASQSDYVAYAAAAINQMQNQWYNQSTGLWGGAWWNSANALTTLADFQAKFPASVPASAATVFETTLSNAPGAGGYPGFINGFYDDELWWALAWIQVYDVTNNETYLNQAKSIFEDCKTAFDIGSTCGALW